MSDTPASREIRIPKRLIRGGYLHVSGPVWKTSSGADRFTLCIPTSMLDDPSSQVLLYEEYAGPGYEAEERRLLDRLMPPNCLFLDVGAHWGVYSLHALTAHPGVTVIAIEPDRENLTHLHHNLAVNGLTQRARVIAAAAAERAGTRWLRRNTAMGHHIVAGPPRAGARAVRVETVTIDSVIGATDPEDSRAVWLKLDVEGREWIALEGARATLASGRVAGVLWEISAGGLTNPDTDAIMALLSENGFLSYIVNDGYRLSLPAGTADPGLRRAPG